MKTPEGWLHTAIVFAFDPALDDVGRKDAISRIQADAIASFTIERNAALKLLDYDESESDLLANIKRLKAYYEGELSTLRDGTKALLKYASDLQNKVVELDPNFCGHLTTAYGILLSHIKEDSFSPSPEASHGTHEAKP